MSVIHSDRTFPYEVDFSEWLANLVHNFVFASNPCKHVNDQFVLKAPLARVQEVAKCLGKVVEQQFYEVRLHPWRKFLKKDSFFNDQIKVVLERIFNLSCNLEVKPWSQVHRFVTALNFLDPQVQRVQSHPKQTRKPGIKSDHKVCYQSHKQREKRHSKKF